MAYNGVLGTEAPIALTTTTTFSTTTAKRTDGMCGPDFVLCYDPNCTNQMPSDETQHHEYICCICSNCMNTSVVQMPCCAFKCSSFNHECLHERQYFFGTSQMKKNEKKCEIEDFQALVSKFTSQ